MTETFVGSFMESGAMTPFRENIIRRPRFRKILEPLPEPIVIEDDVIYAPRTILLGRLLDKETGEDKGPFYLPIDDIWHEPSILIVGGPGTGKSVTIGRIFSEFVFTGRSGIICDFKGQYSTMSKPNSNPDHLKILEEFGEEPRGLGKIDVWLPNHIVVRNGEEFCKIQYNYSKTFTIRTKDMDAGGLLLLGGKAIEGRDYVQTFDALLTTLRKAERDGIANYELDVILHEINLMRKQVPAKKRSLDVLEAMLDNLMNVGVIADNGNSVLEMIEMPKSNGEPGKVSIFNTGASGPNDIQSKGVIANLINGLCTTLMTEFTMVEGKVAPKYRPLFFIEEASTYFSPSSSHMVMNAFDFLQYTMGRTLGICRTYIYQNDAQMPRDLKDSDTMPIYIKLQQYLDLQDSDGNKTGEINMPGLAIVSIKNVSFMQNQQFYVRILPPKCDIRS